VRPPRLTLRRLLMIIASFAVSLGFLNSLPGLDEYGKYHENEMLCRKGARNASSAVEKAEALRDAEEMAQRKREALSQGATAIALVVLGIGMGMLRLGLWMCCRSHRIHRSGVVDVLASDCLTGLTILVMTLALTRVLFAMAAFLIVD
jgi:hypothetical protein